MKLKATSLYLRMLSRASFALKWRMVRHDTEGEIGFYVHDLS